MLNLTGNHDMGMFTGGVNMKNRTELQKFYLTHFGKWNHKIRLSKWDVLSLSSPHMEDTFSMHQQYKKQTFDFVFAQNQTGFFFISSNFKREIEASTLFGLKEGEPFC